MGKTAIPSWLWPEIIHPYSPILRPQPVPTTAPFDGPCECLFVNAEWRGYLIGALEVLSQRDAWEGTESQIDTTIEGISEIIACLIGGDMSCLSEMTERLDILAACCLSGGQASPIENQLYQEHLYDRYDDTPWSIDEDVPHDSWTETSGDSGAKIAEREAALCGAIWRYLNTIKHGLQINRMVAAGLFDISAGLASIINPVLGVIIWGATGFLVGTSEAVWLDEDATKECACCMYSNLLGETTIDFATFQTSMQGCSFGGVSNEELQRLAFDGVNQQEGNYLAFLDTLGEETRLAGIYERDTERCDCAADWNIVYDFTTGEHDWYARVNSTPPPSHWAVHSPGNGWLPQDIAPGNDTFQRLSSCDIDFSTGATITYFRAYYDMTAGTFEDGDGDDDAAKVRIYTGAVLEAEAYQIAASGAGQKVEWTGSETFDKLRFFFRTCYFKYDEEFDGDVRVYRIEIGGTGEEPIV